MFLNGYCTNSGKSDHRSNDCVDKAISVDEFGGGKWKLVNDFVANLKDIPRSGSRQNYDNRGGYNHNRNQSRSRPKSFWVHYDTNDYNAQKAADKFKDGYFGFMNKRRFVSPPLNEPILQPMDFSDLALIRSQIRGSGILTHVIIIPPGMEGSKLKRDIERVVLLKNMPSKALTQDRLHSRSDNHRSFASTQVDLQFIITDTCYKSFAVDSTIEGL